MTLFLEELLNIYPALQKFIKQSQIACGVGTPITHVRLQVLPEVKFIPHKGWSVENQFPNCRALQRKNEKGS